MKKKRVIVIVAHPDDETLWMGGTLIRNKDKWDTTIISLSRKYDKDRMPKFMKACLILNVKGFISDLEDDKLEPLCNLEIKKRILSYANGNYDYLFTHGKNGEYGHIRHIETHEAVKELLENKKINARNIFFFSYKKVPMKNTDTGFDSIVNLDANKFINLNNLEFLGKKNLIENIYGFKKGGFEERNSRNQEAFNLIK